MRLDRRALLAAGLAPWSARAQTLRDTAPAASDVATWAVYAQRLETRAVDAGGGRFDPALARAALDLANAARANAGAGTLLPHAELQAAARAHAADLLQRRFLEHVSPEGFDPSHRLWLVGRTTIGSPSENIAFRRGPDLSAESLVASWRRSPGHWRNLLRPDHTNAGFAAVRRDDRAWLVGLFSRPLAQLGAPLALRPTETEIADALASIPDRLRPRLAPPQGSRPGSSGEVCQIAAMRIEAPGRFAEIGGPIILPFRQDRDG